MTYFNELLDATLFYDSKYSVSTIDELFCTAHKGHIHTPLST
jgi:hypothetical protein